MYDDAAQIPTYAQKAIALATSDRMAIVAPNSRQFRPNEANNKQLEVINDVSEYCSK
jgi:hypothetical protein